MIKLSTRSTTLSNVQKSTSNSQARSLSLDELEKVTGGVRCFVKSWSTSGDADDRPTEGLLFLNRHLFR